MQQVSEADILNKDPALAEIVRRLVQVHECVIGQRRVTETDLAQVRCGAPESMRVCR